jgi:anti-sigma B factor antagonist
MAIKAITSGDPSIAILELHGPLVDYEDTSALKAKANELFEQGNRKLIVDLSNVSYVNSLGIGSLVSIYTTYTKGNGKIRLAGMGKSIQNVFVITRLISIFDVDDTREGAIKAFGK